MILFWVEIFECLGEERSDGVSMTCQTNNYRCLVSLLLSLTSVRLEEQNTQLEKLQKQTTCLGTNQDPQWPCWLLLRLTELQSVSVETAGELPTHWVTLSLSFQHGDRVWTVCLCSDWLFLDCLYCLLFWCLDSLYCLSWLDFWYKKEKWNSATLNVTLFRMS